MAREIMLVVGEASGDAHGARLVEALHRRDGTIKVFGVAGEQLQATRFEALFSVARLTGMGLVELAGNLGNILRAYRLLKQALKKRRPNLLVLIDFPEFNLRLARLAKSLRIPVLYYISPQIWAWRQGRVKQIAKWVDHMAVVFPFEVDFYARHQVKVSFVGHPLLETVRARQDRGTVLRRLGLDPAKLTIGLLPGSRHGEVSKHLSIMRDAALLLRQQRGVQFFCVRANTIEASAIEALLQNSTLKIPIVDQERYEAINAADLIWTASGTATLEVALLGRPMIVVYRMSPLTYWLGRRLVQVEHVAMANLLAGERLVPELLQDEVNPARLVSETIKLLDDHKLRLDISEKLSKLRERLGTPGAADRVADIALSMMTA
ncbi:MAG: lipid-A-disaccharide synthase [Deltaproteobacteria bacterium]|nr:lipid-A-disaccharide synthase [Deltaproteobacteria bacterium]